MKTAPDPLQPQSSAQAPIKGYHYQFALSALRWLQLGRHERIVFEGDDDIVRYRNCAIREGNFTIYEQVKDLTRPINLGVASVRKTLARFITSYAAIRLRDTESRFIFILTTTARLKRQLRANGIDVLADWHNLEKRPAVIAELRGRLLSDPAKRPAGGQAVQPKSPDLPTAIQWFDEIPERWNGFFDTVKFDPDAPDLPSTLQLIKDSLSRRPGTRDLADDLTLRLIMEVLHISSKPELVDRIKDRKSLENLFQRARKDLAGWRDSREAGNLRKILNETINLEAILRDPSLDLNLDIVRDSPGKLLPAYYETVPFDVDSRLEETKKLEDWCLEDTGRSVWLIHGEGGSGKTRLLLEWCQRLEDHGWYAGFLNTNIAYAEPAALHTLFKGLAPRLVVIDYAEQHPDAAQRLIEQLSERKSGPKVRLVLLTRRVPDWWWNLGRRSEAINDLLSPKISREPLRLLPLFSPGPARDKAISEAIRVFSEVLGKELPAGDFKVNLERPIFNNALFLYMEALSIVYGDAPESRYDILETILTHERRFWQKQIDALNLDKIKREALEDAIGPVIAAVTLLGDVSSRHEALNLVESVTGSVLRDFNLIYHLLDILKRFIGKSNDSFMALQPDLLGEQLIESILKQYTRDRESMLLTRVFEGVLDTRGLLNLMKTTMRLLLRRGAPADPTVERGRLEHGLQWLETRRRIPPQTWGGDS